MYLETLASPRQNIFAADWPLTGHDAWSWGGKTPSLSPLHETVADIQEKNRLADIAPYIPCLLHLKKWKGASPSKAPSPSSRRKTRENFSNLFKKRIRRMHCRVVCAHLAWSDSIDSTRLLCCPAAEYHALDIHSITERCFTRCVTGSLSGGKLTSKEEGCMQNCVERFMDTNLAVLKHLETLRAGQ